MKRQAATESVRAAATRLRVNRLNLRAWLIEAGHTAPATGKAWRLPCATFDEVVNRRRQARKCWTTEQDSLLRSEWRRLPIKELARKVNRSVAAVHQRAVETLGLPIGIPAGKESVFQSAKRCGFDQKTMRKILSAHGVELHRYTAATSIRSRYCVEPCQANAAVAAWLETEKLWEAAQRLGIESKELLQWLIEAGHERPEKMPWTWRLPSSVFEAVVNDRRKVA